MLGSLLYKLMKHSNMQEISQNRFDFLQLFLHIRQRSLNGISYICNFENYDPTLSTIICLHGNSSSGLTFINVATITHGTIQIIAPDLPGCGLSDRLDSYSVEIEGNAISEFIHNLGITEVFLWGHSLGGHLLHHIPPRDFRIMGVILAGTPPLCPTSFSPDSLHPAPFTPSSNDSDLLPLLSQIEPFTYEQAERFVSHTGVTGNLLEIMIREAMETDGRFRAGCLGTLTNGDQIEWLRQFDQTVIFQAEDDGVINLDYLNFVKDELNIDNLNSVKDEFIDNLNSINDDFSLFENTIHIVNGSKHMCPVTHPEFCIDKIKRAFNI